MKFSVIIPTYQETQHLRQCIRRVRDTDPDVEIIIADGGSTDNTVEIAKDEHVSVCHSLLGRGLQCNAGAVNASGNILLFLHADTFLPLNAFEVLRSCFDDERVQVGTFRLAFDVSRLLLRFYSFFTRFDSIFTRFGDQCIVVRKSFYETIGGFPDWPLFEDVRLLHLARERTTIQSFPAIVTTSARRFLKRGIIRQQLRNGWYIIQYLMGESPERLARKYNGQAQPPPSTSLIVFARYPHPGKVKTRLARTIGKTQAAELYKACVEHIFNECNKLPDCAQKILFYADESDVSAIERWAPRSFRCLPQSGDALGERMSSAFSYVFNNGSKRAIIIGTDVPDITANVLDQAINSLDNADVVIGPSNDGGYYLLGMNRFHPELFDDIPWSTNVVFERTMAVVHRLGLRAKSLLKLMDIDTEADIRHWSITASTQTKHPLFKAAQGFRIAPSIESAYIR
ncbi:MAG: TIGR04283 family arsenosugar biosynthesis glycosyltransferase [Ignavibacteriae bacterium]|nr:TIGR04283 family arsenosugar biosynthesis glycosyltransferase [Ignavibacteriota bacterium]